MTWQLLILEKEPPIILRWPQKCSRVTGKTIKGRNPSIQFYWDILFIFLMTFLVQFFITNFSIDTTYFSLILPPMLEECKKASRRKAIINSWWFISHKWSSLTKTGIILNTDIRLMMLKLHILYLFLIFIILPILSLWYKNTILCCLIFFFDPKGYNINVMSRPICCKFFLPTLISFL